MSQKTNIEWADSTGNPWIGCTKVSPGCANCYAAELDAKRFSRTLGGGTKENPISHWDKGAPRFRTKTFWKDALKWNREAAFRSCGYCEFDEAEGDLIKQCKTCARRPRIFPSLCDWLDDEVPIEWLVDFLKLIHDTPNLDWLLLTKRPENFLSRIYAAKIHIEMRGIDKIEVQELLRFVFGCFNGVRIPPNVWIGVSVEDQKRADERVPLLLQIPARVRFLSVEPLLGPVSLRFVSDADGQVYPFPAIPPEVDPTNKLHWVIVGGESGDKARPCQVEWIRSIVSQCKAAGVPCFVKQLGAHPCMGREDAQIIRDKKGGDMAEWPAGLRVRQFPSLS